MSIAEYFQRNYFIFQVVLGLVIGLGCLFLLIVYTGLVSLCALFFRKRCKCRASENQPQGLGDLRTEEDLQRIISRDHFSIEMGVISNKTAIASENSVHNPAFVSLESKERNKEFPKSNICILKELGETTFGPIYRGEATGLSDEELSTSVLIKTLKLGSSKKVLEEFSKELRIVAEFDHPNLLPLLGACTRDEPKYLIYEYLEYGTLKHFLQSTAAAISAMEEVLDVTADDGPGTPIKCHPVLDYTTLLSFGVQIASAMDYLHEKEFVHQDLATRNVHVSNNMTVKIANFGFSRDIRSGDYYHMTEIKDKLLPIRWLAPETLKEGIYSPESDVWAFGVVLWEIFGAGQMPYKSLSNPEVIQRILKFKYIPKREDCPNEVYKVIVSCWQRDPQARPTFSDLRRELSHLEASTNKMSSKGWSLRKKLRTAVQRTPKTPKSVKSVQSLDHIQ